MCGPSFFAIFVGTKSSTAGLKHERDANVGPEFDEYFEGMFL
jgi:hypothetical protein